MLDVDEQALEGLVENLKTTIEEKLEKLNPTEIAMLSSKIPHLLTMLEYRNMREKFLDMFSAPMDVPRPLSYSEYLFEKPYKECDLSNDIRQSLQNFFEGEIERVNRIVKLVKHRCIERGDGITTHIAYANFMDSTTKRIFRCEEGMLRLNAGTLLTFSAEDLFIELSTVMNIKKRNAMLKDFLHQISKFPLTMRKTVYQDFLDATQDSLIADTSHPVVPFYVRTQDEMNKELERLAVRFGLDPELTADDGQQFLYHANRTFDAMWQLMNTFDFPKKSIKVAEVRVAPTMNDMIQKALVKQLPSDLKMKQLIESYMKASDAEVKGVIKEFAQFYNSTVGNVVRGHPVSTYSKDGRLLAGHHVTAWLKLRFIHAKFLACSILSHLNYFDYVIHMLHSDKVEVKVRRSENFGELFEVYDESGPFIFASAMSQFKDLMEQVIGVGAYYIQKLENNAEAQKLIDREAIIEELFQYELRLLNAQRSIVETLLEAYEHSGEVKLRQHIYDIIAERPRLNPPMYRSYKEPYNLAVEVMERKARILRTLLNMQLEHERHVGIQALDDVPLFDRPVIVKLEDGLYRKFSESVLITPFEVYSSLGLIGRFLEIVPQIAKEFCESADIKSVKFGNYMENILWKEIDKMLTRVVQTGLFPYDRASTQFNFLLSDSINSLFTSRYVNGLESLASLTGNMNEGRKVRFAMSARKFIHFTWKLQKLVAETNVLQTAYFEQCDQLGISERSVLLSPFMDPSKKDGIEIHSSPANDKFLDFALSEFETVSQNFAEQSAVQDLISNGNYTQIKQLIKFQIMQNVILEICVRFNSMIMDSDFFVNYFALSHSGAGDGDVDVFLTSAPDADNAEATDDDDNHTEFFRQFVAAQMFYQSTALFRDNEAALEDKTLFLAPIRALKTKTRTSLATAMKMNEGGNDGDSAAAAYIKEMLGAFSPYAYRVEIARICTLERQTLLCNSLVDTYIVGPVSASSLVNEAGRFEIFFYVPTWVEIVHMLKTAGWQRQSDILKSVVQFVIARFQILSYVRFECSLSCRASLAFESIYNQSYVMDTGAFQKLFNELGRLANGREIEVALEFIQQKERFFELRFEYTMLQALEGFFVSLNVGNKEPTPAKEEQQGKGPRAITGVTDPRFGSTIKEIWLAFHGHLAGVRGLLNVRRYIPVWQEEFLHNCVESDRLLMISMFKKADEYVDSAIAGMKTNAFVESFELLPSVIDVLGAYVRGFHLKLAYLLLLYRVDEKHITLPATIFRMNQKIYLEGLPIWNDVIRRRALEQVVPEEPAQNTQQRDAKKERISETKLQYAIIETVKGQIDALLLANQSKRIQTIIQKFSADVAQCRECNVNAIRPDFIDDDQILVKRSDSPLLINPREAETQYYQEARYAQAKLLNIVASTLEECLTEKERDEDGCATYSGDTFEDNCTKVSHLFNVFWSSSFHDFNLTWKQYMATMCAQLRKNQEAMDIIGAVGEFAHRRFARQIEAEVAMKCQDQILELNGLADQQHMLLRTKAEREHFIEQGIRFEFDQLVADLKAQIAKRKSLFREIQNDVYNEINCRIQAAKQVRLTADLSAPSTELAVSARTNGHLFEGIRKENEEMRKEILKLRICRCISEMANSRFYSKRLAAVEGDRKAANAQLWSNRLQYETLEVQMEKQLEATYRRLEDTEIEIEQLKQQLDTEKLSNIQLVHWKAKNLKTVDNLKAELTKFKNMRDINIGELRKTIEERQEELSALRAEGDDLARKIGEIVSGPQKEICKVLDQIQDTRVAKAELMQTLRETNGFELERASARSPDLERFTAENTRLRHLNELLRQQIDELSRQLPKQSETSSILDSASQRTGVSSRSLIKTSVIVRPTLQKTRLFV